jgi:hypothetical protein
MTTTKDHTNAKQDMETALELATRLGGDIRWETGGFTVMCKERPFCFGWHKLPRTRDGFHWRAAISGREGYGNSPREALDDLIRHLLAIVDETSDLAVQARHLAADFDEEG